MIGGICLAVDFDATQYGAIGTEIASIDKSITWLCIAGLRRACRVLAWWGLSCQFAVGGALVVWGVCLAASAGSKSLAVFDPIEHSI
jgi:hypothetical protein